MIVGVSLWWSLVATLKFATATLPLKLAFYRLEMVAWVGLPISTTSFALIGLYYSDLMGRRLLRVIFGLLTGLFAVSILVPQSVLFFNPRLVSVGGVVSLEHDVSITLAIITGVAWTVLLLGISVVLYHRLRGRPIPLSVVAGVVIPFFPGTIALLKLFAVYPSGGEGFNIAPVANALAVTFFVGVVHYDGLQAVATSSRHAAMEAVEAGYLLSTQQGVVLDTNDSAKRLTTVSVGEQVPSWLSELPRASADKQHVRTPAGREVSVQRTMVDGSGEGHGVFLIHDVTERLRRMREIESRDLLISALPVGVFRIDESAPPHIVYANQRLAELFGFPDSDAMSGRAVSDVFGSLDLIDDSSIRSTVADPHSIEHKFSPPAGNAFWGLVSVYPSSTEETEIVEGVVVDISAEKQAEKLLRKTLTDTARDRDLIERLWKHLMSFNGFDGFASAALSVMTTTTMVKAACIVRPSPIHEAQVEFVAADGPIQFPHDVLVETIEWVYTEATQHTTEITHEGTSYSVVATPVVTEHVVDSVLIAATTSPANERLSPLAEDVATALAYKRTLTHREHVTDTNRFVQLQVTVPNRLHPLSRFINAAGVETTPLSFSVTRVDEATTRVVTQADRDVCEALTAAADAADSGDSASATAVSDDQWRCQLGVETADIHHRLAVEDVSVISISANAMTTNYTLHLLSSVDVAGIMDIFRMRWPQTRLQSRKVTEAESVAPRVFNELDEHQRQALEVATRMGFFHRPQGATAADVADALDTSRSTVTRRVRAGENAVFESLFTLETDHDDERPDDRLSS